MNYSNMIEEKNLKKGFILATLASTIIGTFTASLALHDKIRERQEKSKQAATDKNQNEELKKLQEEIGKLRAESNNDDGDKNYGERRSRSKSSSRSRSRSRSDRRRRKRNDDYDDPETSARVQHVVVGVIRDAMSKNPHLSEADVQKLVAAAEEAARDGTVDTLREHYQRMVLPAAKPLDPEEQHKKLPMPLDLPRGQRPSLERHPSSIAAGMRQDQTRSYTSQSVAGSRHDSHLENIPNNGYQHKPGLGRHLEERKPAEILPALPPLPRKAVSTKIKSVYDDPPAQQPQKAPTQKTKSVYGDPFAPQAQKAPSQRSKSVHVESSEQSKPNVRQPSIAKARSQPPEPSATRSHPPPQQQRPAERDNKSTKAEAPKSRAASQGPPASERRPSSTKTEVPKARSLPHQPDWKPPQQKYDDPFGGAKSVKASTRAAKSPTPNGARSEKATSQTVKSTNGAKSAAPTHSEHHSKSEVPSRPPPARSEAPPKSTKTEPPKSRAASQAPSNFIAPIPIPAPPLGPAHIPSPPHSASSTKARHPKEVREVREIHEVREVRQVKALPAPPNNLFCRYASDLQKSHLPLHPNFKSSGSHRCPTCSVSIPVDTRDVWVLSTRSPSPKAQTRDYRMDARFVAKCHTTDGEFACVLCERFRERDFICRSVEGLVTHLGKEHGAEEFERDGDLVRMDEKMVVRGKGGREMALA